MEDRPAQPFDLVAGGLFFNDMVFYGLPASGPQPGHELRTAPYLQAAGGIGNSALAAARIGLDTALMADIGDDAFGRGSLEGLEMEGVNTDHCLIHRGWQTPLTVIMNYAGDRAMVTAETAHPGACVLRQRTCPGARVAIAQLQPFEMPWLAQMRRQGTRIVGDVGWDESGRWNLDELPDLWLCHSFTPNVDEALAYTGAPDAETALRQLAELVPEPVITMGADGALAWNPAKEQAVHASSVKVVAIDAAGAGDVFNAAWAAGMLTNWNLEQRLNFAMLFAGLTVSRAGGGSTAPTLTEVVQWVASQPHDEQTTQYQFLNQMDVHRPWHR